MNLIHGGWNWQAKPDRFQTERSNYDFRTLKFIDKDKALRVKPFDQRSDSTENTSSLFSDATHGLNIDPSQQVVRRASARMGSTTVVSSFTGGGSSDGFTETDNHHPTAVAADDNSGHLRRLAFGSVTLVGMDDEIERLNEAYKDQDVRMLTIVGPSGSGKSFLANEIQKTVSLRGGVLVRGKFDVQNRADPYQAFVEVIQNFLLQMKGNKTRREELSTSIHDTIGEDIDILFEIVPDLESFLHRQKHGGNKDGTVENPQADANILSPSSSSSESTSTDRNITERAARIQNVSVEFLRLISSHDHPLTILLDDIQWAGSASLALIEEILEDDRLKNFFFLTTCRDGYLRTDTNSLPEDENGIVVDKEEKPNLQLIEVLRKYSSV